jgi:nucleotidyltransferase/DNA polymerase involved in DNA repair
MTAKAVAPYPDLIVVPPHFAAYRTASAQVMERLRRSGGRCGIG